MFCSKCGEKLTENDKFCGKCGSVVGDTKKSTKTVVASPAVVVDQPEVITLPEAYKPISAMGYVGYLLLFNIIPCVSWILMIIFACGVSENKNVTNLARAHLILWLISIVLIILLYILIFVVFAAVGSTAYYY